MKESAWLEIDAAATQIPIPEARRLRPLAPADLARCGRRSGRRGQVFAQMGRSLRLDSDLNFGIRHQGRKFARKRRIINSDWLKYPTPHLTAFYSALARRALRALRYAVPAARKPWATILGHPCDACVAPAFAAFNAQAGCRSRGSRLLTLGFKYPFYAP